MPDAVRDGALRAAVRAVAPARIELTDHLGYEPHPAEGRGSGNSGDGTTGTTAQTVAGPGVRAKPARVALIGGPFGSAAYPSAVVGDGVGVVGAVAHADRWLEDQGDVRCEATRREAVMEELRPHRTGIPPSLFGLIFFVFSCVWIVVWLRAGGSAVNALFGGVFAVIGVVLMVRGVVSAIASSRVGDPLISVATTRLPVGGRFVVAYEQTWKRAAEVNRIVVQLVLRETVRYTRGTDTDTDTHDDVVQELVTEGRRFEAGEVFRNEYALRIPEDGMHTFTPSWDNRIEWFVRVSVDIADWPDLEREYEITVLPELAR